MNKYDMTTDEKRFLRREFINGLLQTRHYTFAILTLSEIKHATRTAELQAYGYELRVYNG